MIKIEFDFDLIHIDFSVLDKFKCFVDDLFEIIENTEIEIFFYECEDVKIFTLINDKDDIKFRIEIRNLIDTWNEYLYMPS